MKRTALQHTKMKRLMRALDVPQYVAVGILESLWNLTARETPTGQIGKLSNEDIALQIDWRDNPDTLVQALMVSGWLDINEEMRLLVHDWHEHADNAVHATLARRCERFANGQIPKSGELNKPERERFNSWLETEGVDRRPQGRPVDIQIKAGDTADKSRVKTGENHEPLPLPLPLPDTKTPPSAREDDPPEGLARMQYATWLLEQCNIPAVRPAMFSADAAIGTFGRKHKQPDHIAVLGLRDRAIAAHSRGDPVNKFWLEDPNKWEPKANGGSNGTGKSNRAQSIGRTDQRLREMLAKRGIHGTGADGGGDGTSVPQRPERVSGDVDAGNGNAGGDVWHGTSPPRTDGDVHRTGPDILPPTR